MKIRYLLLALSFIMINHSIAQSQLGEGYKAELELQAIGTTNGVVPFWLRSNQYGSIPLPGASASVLGRFSKEYQEPSQSDLIYGRKKLIDWGFGIEGRSNGGKHPNAQLIEGYVKGRFSIFQLKAGRSRDVMGLNGDTTLSSGNFAVSGNALGIPKVELSIPDFYRLPFFNGLISIKGTFSHGWVGHRIISDTLSVADKLTKTYTRSLTQNAYTYFHQKSFYGRIGKEDWRLNLIGGFSHQVNWGSESEIYGPEKFQLNGFNTFIYVITGKAYGGGQLAERSKIGNQIGSIDLGLEYKFNNVKLLVYRQNFYDVGALSKLANISDGLNGISFENLNIDSDAKKFIWKKLIIELFASKNQAGYPWSIPTASGDEDYYNNYYYRQGWSYKGIGIGNPLITRNEDARSGQETRESDYFINNRVIAIHLGLNGEYKNFTFLTKLTYSWNHGTFATSSYGTSTGPKRNPQTGNIFKPVQQVSFYLEGWKELSRGYTFGVSSAIDNGKLLNNSIGLILKLKKGF